METSVDLAGEAIDRLIGRRASEDRMPDPDEQEERWKASVRAYNARREAENRAAWCEFHRDQAKRHRGVLETLIAYHERAAERLKAPEGTG